jgi:hypothetical protein
MFPSLFGCLLSTIMISECSNQSHVKVLLFLTFLKFDHLLIFENSAQFPFGVHSQKAIGQRKKKIWPMGEKGI